MGDSYCCWVIVGVRSINPDRCRQEKCFPNYIEGRFQKKNMQGLPQPQATSIRVFINYTGDLQELGSLKGAMVLHNMLVEVTFLQMDS